MRKKEKLETLQGLKADTAQWLRRKTPEQTAKVQIPAQLSSSPQEKYLAGECHEEYLS